MKIQTAIFPSRKGPLVRTNDSITPGNQQPLNALLQSQLTAHFGPLKKLPAEFSSLLETISASYTKFEADRDALERSVKMTSTAMVTLNQQLKNETAEVKSAHSSLRNLFENIREVFFTVDVKFDSEGSIFRTLDISPACFEVYGYRPEDFLANPMLWRQQTLEEDKHLLDQNFHLLAKGEAVANDYRIHHKDGTVRWISTKITPTLDATGKLVRLDGVTRDINEKKHSEQKLKEAHDELNRILQNISEVVFSLNVVTGEYAYISAACENVYGYRPDEFQSNKRLWKEVMHPEDTHLVSPNDSRLRRGHDFCEQFRIIHKNGSIRWIDAHVRPTLDKEGVLVKIDIIVNDITETKTAQQKLEEKNAELTTLFNNINEVLFSVDMVSMKLIQMSSTCEKVYGYSSEEFLTQHDLWQNVIHTDDKHISYNQMDTLYKGGQVFNQYRIIHKDGSIRWIENKVIPTLGENGKLIRLDGVTNDITAKRENAQKLQESEMRFRTLIENGSDMLTMFNAEGLVIYENPAIATLLGTTMQNPGRDGLEIVHPDDKEMAMELFDKSLENKELPVEIKVRLQAKTGDYFFAEGHITNLLHVDGVNAIVSTLRDISRRVDAEKSLGESQNKYKMVYENPFLGIAIGTNDGKLKNVNEAFCKMLGYTQAELRDQHFSLFTVAEDLEKELPYILQMANGEIDTYQLEKRYLTKSKAIIWVELSISCVKDETGKIQSIVAVVQDISAKKAAEDSLRKSEVNLTAIIENTDACVYSLDRNFCYITYNTLLSDNLKIAFGIDVQPGDKAFGFLEEQYPEEAAFWKKTYTTALTGKTIQFVKEHDVAGSRVYNSFSIHPIFENKEVIGLSCTSRDITQNKLAEKSLHKSEANLRNILENSDTAYVLLNKNKEILSFNHLAHEMGMEEMGEELKEGVSYVSLMLDERKQEVDTMLQAVLDSKERVSYEIKYTHAHKPDRWLSVSMHPIFDFDKQVLGLSVAATDITLRKNSEQLVRESNERYELVTKATNDVIWDWDIVNNKVFRSENYEHIFGYEGSGDNMYVQSIDTNVHPDDAVRILESITEKIEASDISSWEEEYRFFRKNGELAYVQDRGHIIYDENKRPVRMVGAMRDITTEKTVAIERSKITADLIRQNKNLEQFAYIVSHNLRAPIANIIGLLHIIQTPDLEPKVHAQSMEGLTTSVKRLDGVIIDLTNILQVKCEIDEKREHIRFSVLLEDIRQSIRSFIEQDDVSITADFSEVDEIFSVKSYLYSIFYNLIINSIKYRKPGRRPVINIYSRESANKVTLVFCDNGSGIDLARYGDKIFGLYKRFHYDVEGKGMGLFMVKTQVESLEGNISVRSQIDEGSEFTVEFEKKVAASLLKSQS